MIDAEHVRDRVEASCRQDEEGDAALLAPLMCLPTPFGHRVTSAARPLLTSPPVASRATGVGEYPIELLERAIEPHLPQLHHIAAVDGGQQHLTREIHATRLGMNYWQDDYVAHLVFLCEIAV